MSRTKLRVGTINSLQPLDEGEELDESYGGDREGVTE